MTRSRSSSDSSASSHRHSTLKAAAKATVLGAVQNVARRMSSTGRHHPNDYASSEREALLARFQQQHYSDDDVPTVGKAKPNYNVRGAVWGVLVALMIASLVVFMRFPNSLPDSAILWLGGLPLDPIAAANGLLKTAPVIDGHIDLPILARELYRNNASAIDLDKEMPAHVDIPRLRAGGVGGFFWSVYVDCPDPKTEDAEFLNPTWKVRDTLEQIDLAVALINKYPGTFGFASSTEDMKKAITQGKIASLLGVEGAHQIGDSLAVLRQFHALGVRYMTLTHVCHNPFADSCGFAPGMQPLHHGLSEIGYTLIDEMNRLGVMVDLSHTSDETATQAIKYSKAPVIWSHSSARAVHDVPRNVPDSVLKLIGTGPGQKDAVVMVNFAPFFVAPEGKATTEAVADHVEHIAKIAGRKHVGIGSDFDGIGTAPEGLEDVSKYPNLIAELYKRGWTKSELSGLTGANLLRVFEGVERVSAELKAVHTPVKYDIYDKRSDL